MALSGQRFKIDHYDYPHYPYALYIRERGLLRDRWRTIQSHKTREECKELYERIKDLPEYLD